MTYDFITKFVGQLAPLIRQKKLSSLELTKAILEQSYRLNDQINAYINIDEEKAINMAKNADKEIAYGNYRGVYHGIPVGIKDNIYVKNELTTMGSKIHKDFKPAYNATVINKLKKAGAVFTGKLNMHEYAHGPTNNNPHFGATKNPWNKKRIPGSSSGGSGAAVAAGMSIAALGTDSGGSIRIPASACGIVGIKPTHGRVSKHGVFPLAWSLDHIGPMTKTVQDAAAMLQIISGYDPLDYSSIKYQADYNLDELDKAVNDMVIGINENYFFNKVDSQVADLVKKQVDTLVEQGAKVKLIKLPALEYAEFAILTTLITEPSAVHHENIQSRPEDFGKDLRILLKLGELHSAVDYLQAQQYRKLIKDDFQKAFEEIDVLITPTIPFIPPFIGDNFSFVDGEKVDLNDEVIRFTGPGNLTGLPALSLPCGRVAGMPVGLQIIGNAFREDQVLTIGNAIERNVEFQKETLKMVNSL
ncbi:amidase [Pseudogracilibacillus sp. SO30301A]|uniref:amidase n=1 Tax=Pseudogracilibacillus sp. SO30301A TaxID=3098291 RepID=UPI00300E0613